ncbi:uncharacterized protein LOC101458748 isoform X2 [Ceratitis capitata]|uniref:uncharacterized protein LOC101458748 isoform X2 n=1 Tax=Ceratitis capitata TaxID=7213 RepID=UPI000A11A1E5|nr:uncharacterized protein LOC101458748 isoform X2 [Ceratitis capitata]
MFRKLFCVSLICAFVFMSFNQVEAGSGASSTRSSAEASSGASSSGASDDSSAAAVSTAAPTKGNSSSKGGFIGKLISPLIKIPKDALQHFLHLFG